MRIIPNRDYRLLVAGGIVSQLGDWAARLALALLVFERTQSATAVGLTAALFVLPWLGPGQLLAAQGDRLDRRRLLVLCDWSRAGIFIAIGAFELPLLVVLALVTVAATIDPVFEANRSALVADVVSHDDYADAIGFNHAISQAAQLVGYGSGGLLVAVVGAGDALALNGVTFAISAGVISLISAPKRSQRQESSPSLLKAFRFLREDPLSALATSVTLAVVFTAMSVESQAAVYGTAVAGLSSGWIGLLAAALPAVNLALLVVLPTTGDDVTLLRRGFTIGLVAAVPGAAVLGFGGTAATAFVGYALVGAVFLVSPVANMVVGRRIPSESRASTFAVLQAAVFVALSSGAVSGGAASDLLSPKGAASAALALAAAGCAAGFVKTARLGRSAPLERTKVIA